MYTPMNFQPPPQQSFKQASSSSVTYSRKEVMLQTKLALKMKKPIISCKNEKVGKILVIIILFMFDETFSGEGFCFEQGLKYILLSKYSLNYKYYNKNNAL